MNTRETGRDRTSNTTEIGRNGTSGQYKAIYVIGPLPNLNGFSRKTGRDWTDNTRETGRDRTSGQYKPIYVMRQLPILNGFSRNHLHKNGSLPTTVQFLLFLTRSISI
jgi:hypothetical protein